MSNIVFSGKKRFAHFDGNCFFVSCFLISRPELRGLPVGVLSNNDGCFVSASKTLKKFGIKTGTPFFEVKKILEENKAHIFSSEFETFGFISKLMFRAAQEMAVEIEVYSIDEGFLDISIIPKDEHLIFGFQLIKHIYKKSRIPTCVGIGPTKSLAKLANKWAKSDESYKGVYEINEFNVDWTLEKTPIGNLWGIGKASEAKLKKLGIQNAKQFRDFSSPGTIQKLLTINGRKLQLELQGVVCYHLDQQPEKKEEISHTRTFGKRISELNSLRESLATFATIAAEEMRRQGSVCRKVRIFIMTDPFKLDLPQYGKSIEIKLPAFTCDTMKIINNVWSLLDQIFINGFEYRKAGVILSDFQDFGQFQSSLFDEDDTPEQIALMKAVDNANRIYGDGSVKSAACGIDNEEWKMMRSHKPPAQFTRWSDVEKITKVIKS
jgi:DNA polymerase V